MKHKRKTDIELRDSNILESRFLVILPNPAFVVEFFEPDPATPISLAKAIQDFMVRDILHCYDFLELHCFLNDGDTIFQKLRSIYESRDMEVDGISREEYQSVIDHEDITPLMDYTVREGNCSLPHVTYAVAAILAGLFHQTINETDSWPSVRFVTQDSLLACFTEDEKRLGRFLGGNFDVILEAHDVRVFCKDYYPAQDGSLIFDRLFDWLSILTNRYHLKFYPPLSQTMFYNDTLQRDKVLIGNSLPKVMVTLPCSQWRKMSWYDFYAKFLPILQKACRDIYQLQVAKLPTSMVIKPIKSQKLPSENVFLLLDEEKATHRATAIDCRIVYDKPESWLPHQSDRMRFSIEPFDKALRRKSYVFVFWNSRKGDLEKLYMHERKYDDSGLLEKSPNVAKDIGDPKSAIHKFFSRTVQGFPKKFRSDIIAECMGKYPAMCPMMLYEITLVRSPIKSNCDKMDFYVASMNVAYSNNLYLSRGADSHDLNFVYDVARKIQSFIEYHWNNWPK